MNNEIIVVKQSPEIQELLLLIKEEVTARINGEFVEADE